MANKKNSDEITQNKPNDAIDETNNATDELSQLRSIVFGVAEKNLYQQITLLSNKMEASIKSLDTKQSERIDSLHKTIEHQLSEIDKRLSLIDKNHDDNEAQLLKEVNNLASEHEMFAAATQKDFNEINQALDNESASISNSFNEQLEQLKAHLEEVSNDLTSTKTDRKTLAKLLATMATNLEDDQL